jgi:hypothetical protein
MVRFHIQTKYFCGKGGKMQDHGYVEKQQFIICCHKPKKWKYIFRFSGSGRVVGTATDYGLDGLAIEFQWGRDFPTCPDRPWGPPSLLYNGYRIFPGG